MLVTCGITGTPYLPNSLKGMWANGAEVRELGDDKKSDTNLNGL